MNNFWSYFWPALGIGLLLGIVAGAIGFRPHARRMRALVIGGAATIAAAALWHGPLGAGDRLAAALERDARLTLVNYEIPEVHAHIARAPLTRQLILSGPADDFQRSELVRIIGSISGVSRATWSNGGGAVPLIVQGAAMAMLGFLLGLLVAYLVELRRRYNAQWNW